MQQQMTGILAYGSLIDPEDILHRQAYLALPVDVFGFRRVFNQLPSWRRGESDRIAVLNAERAHGHTLNAVCLCFEAEVNTALQEREKGYEPLRVAPNRIASYPGFTLPSGIDFYLFTGRAEKRSADILPNHDYLRLCIEGAKAWGERFYETFIATTCLADGTALSAYLER